MVIHEYEYVDPVHLPAYRTVTAYVIRCTLMTQVSCYRPSFAMLRVCINTTTFSELCLWMLCTLTHDDSSNRRLRGGHGATAV